MDRYNPNLQSGCAFECIIIITWDYTPVLYQVPSVVQDWCHSCFADSDYFKGLPTEPGIYRCQVRFEVVENSDGDECLTFLIRETERFYGLEEPMTLDM